MIVGAVFLPQAPALVSEVGRAAALELTPVRDASVEALRVAIPHPGSAQGPRPLTVLLLGAADGSSTDALYRAGASGNFRPYGIDLPVPLEAADPVAHDATDGELPLSLTVGAWLLNTAAAIVAPAKTAPYAVAGFALGTGERGARAEQMLAGLLAPEDVILVVVGDGSAARSVASPGYLDARAAPFDTAVEQALASGEAAQLANIDVTLGQAVAASGALPWQVAGQLMRRFGGAYRACLRYGADPFGVQYFVADWQHLGA